MKHLKFLFLVVAILAVSFSKAQTVEAFPSDSVKFIKKISSYMSKTKNKDKAKKLVEEFKELWESGVINDSYRRDIYKQTNLMLKKKARPYPHFETYMRIMMAFASTEHTDKNYQVWIDYYTKILKKGRLSMASLTRFLNSSLGLISENSLFRNTIVDWRASSNSYKLEPYKKDLKVIFDKMTLTCYAKRDSLLIYETQGYYTFKGLVFHGKGGVITWDRSKLSRDSIRADLENYKLNLKKSEYIIDTVLFTNKHYFDKPLYGSLHDKVINTNSSRRISYPQFNSFTKHFQLEEIFKDVNYSGGFSMKGGQFYGAGSKKTPAVLEFFRNDTSVLEVNTTMFIFKKEKILSSNAMVTFRLDTDSIYHPGLKFNFNISKRRVTLTRDKEGMGRAPYIDTYHNVDMIVGKVIWDMEKPKLEFVPGPIQKVAYFESADYYSEDHYLDLQKMDDVNPLAALRRFVHTNGESDEFYADEFANYMRMSMPAIHKYLLGLAFEGFISYNLEKDRVTVLEKTYHYLKASVGDKDYDVIGFISNTDGKNAELSLMTKELKLFGVTQIFLSDSQDVVVFPKRGIVNLKKDRDFTFDGQVNAGLFHFFGRNFDFSYKNFKIDLNDVDRLQMYVKSKTEVDKYGDPVLIPVQSPLHNIVGDLLIDKPFNKSGVKPSPEYPIFNSKNESYSYYDSPNIQNGAYKRDKFYFQVHPYTFDSLDNFERKSLVFKGYFNSADILPGFEEELKLRPDYSLGFVRETPPEGYPVYKGKGNLTGTIDLSNAGLLSSGELRYLTSVTKSSKITLLPEVFKAEAEEFNNTKTTGPPEYPLVEAKNVRVEWYAYHDSLVTHSLKQPIKMYNDKTSLTGATVLQPTGMFGWGLIDLTTAELKSDLYKFSENTFDADTSSFNLKSEGSGNFDFKTSNVNAHLDFVERKGVFKANGEASFVEFPKNQYICYMDQFSWYMDKEMLEMSANENKQKQVKTNEDLGPLTEEDVELSGSQFISVHPRQDSLNFIAPVATYNIKTKLISAKDVRYIHVADAVIYPKDGLVEIEKRAVMRTLEQSKIIANIATRYHTIYNASTSIYSRKEYTSSGDYDYYGQDSTKQIIHFDVVGVDSTMQTYARGKIGITDDFTFNPHFAYNGNVKLFSNSEFLTFSGYTKISHDCDRTKPEWVKFTSEIDPKDIMIPITPPMENINESLLHASLMITNDSVNIYPAFLGKHIKYSDVELVPAEGYLKFDESEGKYKIGSKDKLEEQSLPGNYITLHHSVCNLYGEGVIDLGTDFGRFEMKNGGTVNQNATGEKTSLNLVSFLKFFFNDKCLNIMAEDLNRANEGVETEDFYYKAITEIVGKKDAEDYIAQLMLGNHKKYPKQLQEGIVLSDVKLRWDQATGTYNSVGPIGVGSILKKQVNKSIKGRVQIIKKRTGSQFYLYLEIDEHTWYYFHMARNILKTVSSNQEYNTILKNMKPGDRKLKADKEKQPYSFFPAPESLKKKFLKQFENVENNTEVESEEAPEEETEEEY